MKKKILLFLSVVLLCSCSTGVALVGKEKFICQNLGRTKCKFSVTQYSDGVPTETVEIEVKGGSLSEMFGEIVSKVALLFGVKI